MKFKYQGRLLLLALFGFSCAVDSNAQFGVGARYSDIKDAYWHEVFETHNRATYSDQLISVYALYWFRLKKKRIEFLPEVGYTRSLNKGSEEFSARFSNMYAQVNVDFYFLDLGDDCNCPTFSKQGNVLKRSLFAEISPGIEFRKFIWDHQGSCETCSFTLSKTVPKVYTGLGFDIGVSDLVTITPIAGIGFILDTQWEENLESLIGVDETLISSQSGRNSDVTSNFGLRVLFRPDYLRRRR